MRSSSPAASNWRDSKSRAASSLILLAKSVDCLGADQAGEVRLPSGSEIVTADPANKAHEIHGGCDGDLLKVRLGVPEIAGSSEPEAADGLGDGGLDPGTEIVEADELRRLLSLSSCLQGDVGVARSECHEASCCVWPGAVDLMGTGATVLGRELHLDDRRVAVVDRRAPARALGAHRTGDLLVVPIDREVVHGEALACLRLPT